MKKQATDTRELLLQSAKTEFLKKGFDKASLRIIAKNAGFTTGALYLRFSGKDDLFSALVEPVVEGWLHLMDDGNVKGMSLLEQGQPQKMWALSDSFINGLIDYIFMYDDEFSLLLEHSSGSAYQNFLEELIIAEEQETMVFWKALKQRGYPVKEITEEEIHLLVSIQYQAIFEVIRRKTTPEQTKEHIRLMIEFFQPGWKNLLGM